jgi:photosystem II stability/assembly factor-like uncharacterized protein
MPVLGHNADGRLELFAEARVSTGAHALWHRWQTAPNGDWSAVEDWEQLSLAGPAHRLYTLAGGDVFVRTQAGLFRSSDQGTSWTAVNLPPSPTLVDIDPTNRSVMYASGSGALYKTTNAGAAWTPVRPQAQPGRHLPVAATSAGVWRIPR